MVNGICTGPALRPTADGLALALSQLPIALRMPVEAREDHPTLSGSGHGCRPIRHSSYHPIRRQLIFFPSACLQQPQSHSIFLLIFINLFHSLSVLLPAVIEGG